MVKGRQGERVRLYVRVTILGYKRSKSNQYPNTSLVQIEGVNTKEEVSWYQGKRVAYIYKAEVKVSGPQYHCIWGKVIRPHDNAVKDPNTIMSDTETPTKPTKTEEPPKKQIQSRYETIRVLVLRPSEYAIWKVRMTMFLEATDPEYLDRIKEGPHKPTKLAVAVAGEAAKTVLKEKSDYC
ncbi:hypothetical protein AgCh_024468 [Apium graveolens]